MQIPNEISMIKVGGSEPPVDNDDKSGWWQHHRSEQTKVGVVSRCGRRGAPTLQAWYCDYIVGSTFLTLQELQRAALVVQEKEAQSILARYPLMSDVVALDEPSRGHARPRCSLFLNEPASHVGILVRSWNNDWNTTVFLGAKAMNQVKKKGPLTWMLDILEQHNKQKLGGV